MNGGSTTTTETGSMTGETTTTGTGTAYMTGETTTTTG